jgi:hypothetical protein
VTEHVLVPRPFEVQGRPHAQEEVLRIVEPRRIGGTSPQQQRIGQQGDDSRGREVTQGPWRLLHIRFELVERAVELGVALIDQLKKGREDEGVGRRRVKDVGEAVEQIARTGDWTSVEQREEKLGVVGFEGAEVLELTDLMPDDDAEIPQRMEQAPEKPLLRRIDRAAEQDQQIDVGVEAQMAAAVAAERQHEDWRRRLAGLREDLPKESVDPIGIAL